MVKKIYNTLCGLIKIVCACWVGVECLWESLKAVIPYVLDSPDMRIYGYFFGTIFAAVGYAGLLFGGVNQLVSTLRGRDNGHVTFIIPGILLLAFSHVPVNLCAPSMDSIDQILNWVAMGITVLDMIVFLVGCRRQKTGLFSRGNRCRLLAGVTLTLIPVLLFSLGYTLTSLIRSNIATIKFNEALEGGFDSFTMYDMDGNVYTEEMFRGHKLTMLNVWGTYCGTCIREMPDLQAISEEYDPAVLQILGMPGNVFQLGKLSEEKMAEATEIIQKTGMTFPTLIPSAEINAGVLDYFIAFPTTLFFNEEGKQVDMVLGGYDKEGWEERIEELLANEERVQ